MVESRRLEPPHLCPPIEQRCRLHRLFPGCLTDFTARIRSNGVKPAHHVSRRPLRRLFVGHAPRGEEPQRCKRRRPRTPQAVLDSKIVNILTTWRPKASQDRALTGSKMCGVGRVGAPWAATHHKVEVLGLTPFSESPAVRNPAFPIDDSGVLAERPELR